MKKIILGILGILLVIGLVGCTEGKDDATKKDQKATARMADDYSKTQPIPQARYSQKRQNLIEIQKAQQEATVTTTFFFLEGVGPVSQCSSIGYPIATTDQLTNPLQMRNSYQSPYTIAQMEATGVFTGDSSGTYVICVDDTGSAYAQYWEGYVMAVTGQAKWENGEVVLTSAPTADFSNGEG